MRIIAGRAGGIPLLSPPHDARPTTDRVREAVFSKLTPILPGARVADLFAGSGAMGLEALSRGAETAVFVEIHRGACESIRRNAEKARLDRHAAIRSLDVFTWLATAHGPFDLIFADPPYRKSPADTNFAAPLLSSPHLSTLLAPDGLFVLETLAGHDTVPVTALWNLVDQRTYGPSLISFLKSRTPARPVAG